MKRKLKICRLPFLAFFLFLTSLFYVPCYSQDYNISKFTTENGLAGSQINAVIQDNNGYLWVAIYGVGIARFDGLHFKNYTTRDGLTDNRVLSIFMDSKNNLWIGTYGGGVSRFDGKNFHSYTMQDGLSGNEIYGFAEDDKKNIWIATQGGGIDIYDGQHFSNINKSQSLASNNVRCLIKDSKGNIWAGTEDGLSKITPDQSISNFSKKNGLNCGQVWSLMEDKKGNIWGGTYGFGVFSFDGNAFTHYNEFNGLNQKIVYSICEDRLGNIWMGTDAGGTTIFEDKKITTISEKNGLSHNRVRCLLEDSEGIIWIGTDGGLNRYVGKVFTQYSVKEGLSDKKVISVLEDQDKNIWMGTFNGGLNKLVFSAEKPDEIEKIEHFSLDKGLAGERVWKLLQDTKGRLWIGTNNGLSVYDGKSFKNYSTSHGLPNNMIYAICESEDGKIWIGSDGGISVFDGKSFTNYSVKDGLGHNRVRCIVQDKNKIIWIGTYAGGVTYYFDGIFIPLMGEKKLEQATVYSIVVDSGNNIWFSTFGNGVVRLKAIPNASAKKEFDSFTEDDGLGTNSVLSLNISKNNILWAGTIMGVDAIDLNNYYETDTKIIQHYGKAEGFNGIECHQNAVYTDSKNNTWWGTINGAIQYRPALNVTKGKEPKTHIIDIKLFYGETNIGIYAKDVDSITGLPENLTLPYNQNHLTFNFVGLSFLNPQNVTYTFTLENFDTRWSPPSSENVATYSNLPPGKYTFVVMASNGSGQWNKQPIRFSFTIESPYWEKWWFILSCVLASIGFIVFVIWLRTNKIMRDNLLLDKRVREQTAALVKQNHEKEVLLKEIHHRVKNNLQMVSSLLNLQANTITDKKSLEALQECRNRINSMAVVHTKLYRTESLSEIDFHSHAEQLFELISSSYSIPGKKIKCSILSKNIFLNIDILVPLGLIINELISNSFKYAFTNMDEGNILIELKALENGRYEFIYTDDGMGVDIKTIQEKNSMGIMLLQLLGEQLAGKYNFESNKGFRYSITF
ncbi:MAG TPA: two-component regulator propeller domain-containing protein [Bacteroidia bacterium]|nr:two-component regulator propeller domain-containing protein [Bacteroidia bacterium]